tara:strand:+ start:937 stop:2142 length:1206 start_codon:yes stop_codon:yes gene_type:complete
LLEDVNSTKIFTKDEPLEKEFNPNLQIKLTSKLIENSFVNNLTNNNGRINYEGKLKKISKFKFSKINNFENSEPELIFENDNLIFFDNKGSIIKFNPDSNIIWKKNYYDKSEKKLRPILTFGQSSDTLIVADNTSKYYALNLENGKLLWSKYNSSPFNSQIKTYKDRFFVIDFNNILRCISVKDGTELWNIKTSNTFIKSQKKLSIVVVNNVIYFNNSTGDITAVDTNSGAMLWQTPTQNSTIYEDTFLLKTSNIVAGNNMIIFSNNKNEFYSIDLVNGNLKWKQKINSSIQPTIINDLIFTITNEGYLIIIDSNIGNIIKVTDIFSLIKQKKRNKINPVGFVVAKKNIYLSTDHGRLFIIDIASGKTKSIIKIDKNKISRPFILNKNLFLIKEDSIIKLN